MSDCRSSREIKISKQFDTQNRTGTSLWATHAYTMLKNRKALRASSLEMPLFASICAYIRSWKWSVCWRLFEFELAICSFCCGIGLPYYLSEHLLFCYSLSIQKKGLGSETPLHAPTNKQADLSPFILSPVSYPPISFPTCSILILVVTSTLKSLA